MNKADRAFGIVDRDFHISDPDLLESGHCYVLEVYSFENFLAEKDFLIDLGKHFFALEVGSEASIDWDRRVDLFLHSVALSFVDEHAVAYWCHKNSKICQLENFDVCGVVVITSDGKVEKNPNGRDIFVSETKADISALSVEELKACALELSSLPWQRAFRGHYFLKLLVKFINGFRADLDASYKECGYNRTRTRAELSERHIIEGATPFVPLSASLERFFTSIVT